MRLERDLDGKRSRNDGSFSIKYCWLIGLLIGFWTSFPAIVEANDSEEATNAAGLVVRADWFDRGNLTTLDQYATKYRCLVNANVLPNLAEYDLEVPESGRYSIGGLYAALESRPVEVYLDDELLGEGFSGTTGSWNTDSARWEKLFEVEISAGKHCLKLRRSECVPHICAFSIVPLFELRSKWSESPTLPRAIARTKVGEKKGLFDEIVWNVDWFNEVSLDRKAKKESGEPYEDHFAAETAIALIPKKELAWELLDSVPASNGIAVDLANELTYQPGMFDVSEAEKSSEFNVRVRQISRTSDGDNEATPKTRLQTNRPAAFLDGTVFVVSVERYRLLLQRTIQMIRRYDESFGLDEINGFDESELLQIESDCSDALKRLESLEQTLAAAETATSGNKTKLSDSETTLSSNKTTLSEAETTSDDERSANVAPSEEAKQFVETFFDAVRRYSEIARANPLLDFDELVFVQREKNDIGLPQNWQSNSVLNPNAFNDQLSTLKLRDPNRQNLPVCNLLFKPDYPTFLGDVDLHFDAEKLLFSATDPDRRWNVFEINLKPDASSDVPTSIDSPENRPTTETPPRLASSDENDSISARTSSEQATSKQTPAKQTAKLEMKPLLPFIDEANNYDGCYLPDDSILFNSSACYISVPCVNGWVRVTNLFRKFNDDSIRRLTFDQEHNWSPVVTQDGRILYQRWEYTDTPHAHARLLFLMNPDGTGQTAFYGSNSYWPNSMFYARPIPNDPTRFVAVVGGHHGVCRMGELVLFDVKKGRKETTGTVQRICAKEKIVRSQTDPKYDDSLIVDNLVDDAWPKFLHPYPLDGEYYLVASQPTPNAGWGIYLVDVDGNMTHLASDPEFSYLEPLPLRKTERPPVLVDRVDYSKDDATIFLADVYFGDGLKNVPRGTVKNLRLFTYNYLFPNVGGPQGTVGADGPWDVKQIIGTVPVEPNGSALFKVPANTPIAVQPLDENGKEIQLMRSWFTARPGEFLSCIGCHEDPNSTSSSSIDPTLVGRMSVEKITPWFGETRGFSFAREVQPVLDRYCVACHNGTTTKSDLDLPKTPSFAFAPPQNEDAIFDLRGLDRIQDYSSYYHMGTRSGGFSSSYVELHRFVRRPGMESDYHLLKPTEFSADSTELYQILAKGHYGVQLDAESWNRLTTWIDLNAPYHGFWSEQADLGQVEHWNALRKEIQGLYANITDDQEKIPAITFDGEQASRLLKTPSLIPPRNPFDDGSQRSLWQKVADGGSFPDGNAIRENWLRRQSERSATNDNLPVWAFNAEEAKQKRLEAARLLAESAPAADSQNNPQNDPPTSRRIELADGVYLDLQLIPAGSFVMGAQSKDENGRPLQIFDDEKPCVVSIDKPFWIGTFEISNRQFELFDPTHDSGVESRFAMQFGVRGFYVNAPELPVVRVSWLEAKAFCDWASARTGLTFDLPTESQWEYACRAGTATPFFFGDLETDFANFANLSDQTMKEMVCHPYFKERKPAAGSKYDYWIPAENRFNDGGFLSEVSGKYQPNAWGLFDMHGNVAEWTRSLARPYPYSDDDGRNDVFNVRTADSSSNETTTNETTTNETTTNKASNETTNEAAVNAERVVRGGSWRDLPINARSESRSFARPWQGVYNVGFRVVCEAE